MVLSKHFYLYKSIYCKSVRYYKDYGLVYLVDIRFQKFNFMYLINLISIKNKINYNMILNLKETKF